jgi:hypothetical protein
MDPQNQNSQKTQQEQQQEQQEQASSVPPLEDVAAITEQLKGHGFLNNEISMIMSSTYHETAAAPEPFLKRRIQEDDTDAYFLGLLPKEAYVSSSKRTKFYNFLGTNYDDDDDPKGKKPLTDDNNNTTIVITDSDNDDDDQMKEITEAESDQSDDNNNDEIQRRELALENMRAERDRQYTKETAKRYALEIHSVPEKEDGDDNVAIVIEDGLSTPFSEAIKAIRERVEKNEKNKKKGIVDESLIWVPKRNGQDFVNRRFLVPSLLDMSLQVLAKNADAMVSLDDVSDELKFRLSNLLCDSRRMNGHVLELLLRGFPNVIRLKDCSWLTVEEFTKYFGNLNNSIIEVCSLNLIDE